MNVLCIICLFALPRPCPKKELSKLYKSIIKDERKNDKETQEASEILQDKAEGAFFDEKEFLDKILKMSNTEILKDRRNFFLLFSIDKTFVLLYHIVIK